ncbi:hypothetical protein [Pseudoteredinibacter isoporae]|uniref:Uncharacterized protein n=1 Tax=Pseudoteredinibacter isoporae TaxID=570281 RepID=A0A7X0JTB0_9GAMM|nr:hypothetical protein [Pseudoteredinibacter isoporae]MBB6521752.1 hypothetical protein [Pseudoteredinibacter isoporae]NHO87300.1 hypothetical protein [Pseudoteredinibacter isoporae]NIB23068.1 hypothetical protein [Pseudoteredinibacter isoporae]
MRHYSAVIVFALFAVTCLSRLILGDFSGALTFLSAGVFLVVVIFTGFESNATLVTSLSLCLINFPMLLNSIGEYFDPDRQSASINSVLEFYKPGGCPGIRLLSTREIEDLAKLKEKALHVCALQPISDASMVATEMAVAMASPVVGATWEIRKGDVNIYKCLELNQKLEAMCL